MTTLGELNELNKQLKAVHQGIIAASSVLQEYITTADIFNEAVTHSVRGTRNKVPLPLGGSELELLRIAPKILNDLTGLMANISHAKHEPISPWEGSHIERSAAIVDQASKFIQKFDRLSDHFTPLNATEEGRGILVGELEAAQKKFTLLPFQFHEAFASNTHSQRAANALDSDVRPIYEAREALAHVEETIKSPLLKNVKEQSDALRKKTGSRYQDELGKSRADADRNLVLREIERANNPGERLHTNRIRANTPKSGGHIR